jgi:predicted DCC family thiol-disulfide oxidoreductase YuxK
MPSPTVTLTLLYDGDCPLCLREMRWLQRRDKAGRLAFENIAAPGFDAARFGVTREALMRVMHGVLPDGRIVRRLEALRLAYAAVGLGWVLAPTGWPVLRWPSNAAYALFARHRIRIGRLLGRRCPEGSCEVPRA